MCSRIAEPCCWTIPDQHRGRSLDYAVRRADTCGHVTDDGSRLTADQYIWHTWARDWPPDMGDGGDTWRNHWTCVHVGDSRSRWHPHSSIELAVLILGIDIEPALGVEVDADVDKSSLLEQIIIRILVASNLENKLSTSMPKFESSFNNARVGQQMLIDHYHGAFDCRLAAGTDFHGGATLDLRRDFGVNLDFS